MSLNKALQATISNTPECVAAGYVDLSSGMLLGMKTVDSHPNEILELLAAATAELFQGGNIVMVEEMFKKSRGVKNDGHHYFQEMIILSDNLIHVFLRSKSNEDHVLGLVCRKSANVGLVLTKARSGLPAVEAKV